MLKKIILGALLIGSIAEADDSFSYYIGYVGMNMDYKEYQNGAILDSEESSFSDIQGYEIGFSYDFASGYAGDHSTVTFEAEYMSGDTKYIGSYLGSNAGYGSVVSTTSNEIIDVSLDFSHSYRYRTDFELTPGVGFGYRYWQRKLSAAQIEEYTWYSVRPSLLFSYFAGNFSIGTKVEYQYGIAPKMTATGISGDFKLNSADIFEVSIPLEYSFTNNFAVYGVYVYQRQKIKESDVVYDAFGNGYVEPDSTANNQYVKIGIVFKY